MCLSTLHTAALVCLYFLLNQPALRTPPPISVLPQDRARSPGSPFPLTIGNTWIMHVVVGPYLESIHIYAVRDTIRLASERYFAVDMEETRYFRGDSSGHFYEYRDSCETLLMDFNMSADDTLRRVSCYEGYTILENRKRGTTFSGDIGEQLEYRFDYLQVVDEEQWLTLQEGVGPVVYYPFFDLVAYLKGAIINGQIYGDTLQTGVSTQHDLVPRTAKLYYNHPNPFRYSTIEFDLEHAAQVVLDVFTISGQQVRRLAGGRFAGGKYQMEWDGRDELGKTMPSGIYFCRLMTGDSVHHRKMVLLR